MGGLVLSRKLNEVILIGDTIKIEVIEIRGSGVVRLLITAPKDVPVHRKEIVDVIAREQASRD
jgi:carbon storage regulator